MKVLLLGATGLLGRNVLLQLQQRGIPCRTLVRRDFPETADCIRGSILKLEDLLNAAQGCDAIINCAGTTDMRLSRMEDYLPVNEGLPRLLCQVMDRTPVSVLVHASTANTIASGTPGHPADESAPFGPPFDRSPYALSKLAGEKVLAEYAAAHPEKRIVVVNPGFMLGALDTKPSSGQLMLAAWRRPLMPVMRGGKSFLPVKDAAAAMVNALEKGRGRYLLTGEYLSLKDFYQLQAQVLGYRQRCVVLSDWVVRLIGHLGDLLLKLGIRNTFYLHNIVQMTWEECYDCSKAREELDYPASPVSEAIADFFRWRSNEAAR